MVGSDLPPLYLFDVDDRCWDGCYYGALFSLGQPLSALTLVIEGVPMPPPAYVWDPGSSSVSTGGAKLMCMAFLCFVWSESRFPGQIRNPLEFLHRISTTTPARRPEMFCASQTSRICFLIWHTNGRARLFTQWAKSSNLEVGRGDPITEPHSIDRSVAGSGFVLNPHRSPLNDFEGFVCSPSITSKACVDNQFGS